MLDELSQRWLFEVKNVVWTIGRQIPRAIRIKRLEPINKCYIARRLRINGIQPKCANRWSAPSL